MKKMTSLKLIQLIIFLLITFGNIFLILFDSETRYFVASNKHVLIVYLFLWLTLILSFVFMFLDYQLFTRFRRNVSQLNRAAHADTITGIPNRFSCDSLIEKYMGAPLPANIGCVMIDITNIIEINNSWGREAGDRAIRQFSDTLHLVAAGQCFIGRNGGNKFIALFENCSKEQLEAFVERLRFQIDQTNSKEDSFHILYKYGLAYHDAYSDQQSATQITDLISRANSQIYQDEQKGMN